RPEPALLRRRRRRIAITDQGAINASLLDGTTAVIYAELGFAPPLARGLFCLSRSVGILAHAWEQTQQGGRNKGQTPPSYLWTFDKDQPKE
ncbi:MAG: citrate/2-methylcitrate synthase, partial [Octadecabacter sp.]